MTASFDPSTDPKEVFADPQKALALPIGVASPLWLMFAASASAGVAYWWLNRWRSVTNLEVVLTPALAAPEPEAAPVAPEVAAPPMVEASVAAAEVTAPEPAVDAVEAVAPEPVIEAAPEPILKVAPTPRQPKSKAAAVRAAPRTTSGPTRRG